MRRHIITAILLFAACEETDDLVVEEASCTQIHDYNIDKCGSGAPRCNQKALVQFQECLAKRRAEIDLSLSKRDK